MKKTKKISLWIAGVLVFFMLLVSVFLLVLPRLINIEPVKEQILGNLSREVGGQVSYKKVDISFLPLPRMVIHGVAISIPGKTQGTIKTVTVYPKIWALLTGRIELSGLGLEDPLFRIDLAQRPDRQEDPSAKKALVALTPFFLSLPVEDLAVEQGGLGVFRGGQRLFVFRDIKARLESRDKEGRVDLSCRSNAVERISLKGRFDLETFKGNGQVELARIRPRLLTRVFLPGPDFRLGRSLANLKLSITMNGPRAMAGRFQGSIPRLLLERKDRQLAVTAGDFAGTFQMDGGRTEISLKRLALDTPRIAVAATLVLNRTSPRIRLRVEGRKLDIPSTREAALAIAGDDSTVQKIFQIVRAGHVPAITFETSGNTEHDLRDLRNIVIKGHMDRGKIQIPRVDMDLEAVTGDAVISRGVLNGEDLEAQYGSTLGRGGKLEVGLRGKDAPFHLDILVDADLAMLPPFLKRVVAHRKFVKELDLITGLSGKATGRLVLGDHIHAITPRVDVSSFSLSGTYKRLPFRVSAKGGRFVYDQKQIDLDKVTAHIGRSSFSGISGRTDLVKAPSMDITFGGSRINLAQVSAWLRTSQWWHVKPEDMQSLEGLLITSGCRIKGPLLSPREWQYDVRGKIQHIVLDSALIPGPVNISRGNFRVVQEARDQRLTVEGLQVSILDSSFQISGMLPDYLEGLNRVEMSLQGTAGEKIKRYFEERFKLPPRLRLRGPISLRSARLSWERGKQTSFKADAIVHRGPHVAVDLIERSGELVIKDLRIQDEESRADVGLDLKNDMLDVRFKGHLEKSTLNGLLVAQPFGWGKIKGDIRARISLNQPLKSTAQGTLEGEGLIARWGSMKEPLLIDNISLEARGRHIDVQSAGLRYRDHELMIMGGMDFSGGGVKIDMDARTGDLHWKDLVAFMKDEQTEKTGAGKEPSRPMRMKVEGVVQLYAGSFSYRKFTWKPLRADIFLDSGGGVRVDVKTADICGLSTPGVLRVKGGEVSLDFMTTGKNLPMEPAVKCLWGEKCRETGTFNLQAEIRGKGKPGQLLQNLEGTVNFDARNGRIYRDTILTNILDFLNITEILRGRFPDITKEGFAYHSITIRGSIKDGKFLVKEGTMDGEPADVAFDGEMVLKDQTLDLTVLVSPVKTANWIIRHVPILGRIMGNSLITIPLKVTGPIGKPTTIPIPTTAVGGGITSMMKRIVELPFVLIPANPSEGKK